MERNRAQDKLMTLGLTGQEANLYILLLTEGELTGYESAKQLSISRSNAYVALASLVDKGAAYVRQENQVKKYTPIPLEEYCTNYSEKIRVAGDWLSKNLPTKKIVEEGYVTIEGDAHIVQKMKRLMTEVKERVYISCKKEYLSLLYEDIKLLLDAGKKVVIITDTLTRLGAAKVYVTAEKGVQIGLIVDSKYVLMGEYGQGSNHTVLYTGQQNFVAHYKKALANEIKLIEYMKGS